MDRREFIRMSALSLAAFEMKGGMLAEAASLSGNDSKYSIVILGDTHFDTEPADVYHSKYNEPVEWLNRVQRQEFARNGQMWRERCPRLLKRAAGLIDDSTRMVFQMGDLIQGDCGAPDVHMRMLRDVMDDFKKELGGLPFVTVTGNHDIRGNYDINGNYDKEGSGAKRIYADYMPARMSQELGKKITKTSFSFWIGKDAFIFVDFNEPDDEEVDKLLKETQGARNTFIVVHGPVFPYDSSSCRWFYHGGDGEADTKARLHFRKAFAKRNAIVLCGHTHRTELADWEGDGGRITQMTMNSVWASDGQGKYTVDATGAEQFGELRKKAGPMDDGSAIKDESALFDEYRSGLRRYVHSPSAGCYKMTVDKKHVTIDFYAGDSSSISERFEIR